MKIIKIEALFTTVAMIISLWYVVSPGPTLMFLFVFVAQPAFALAIISALWHIRRDLREKKIW
ncbi:hypothetical protein R9C00_09360 [Flammeovirgaceae bacterium SG7u.111]|nr:hypothetical protein [Flammeovirgaceae bacterium SG7u.132]WPO37656.1 hypothetical protein R9C00_09360 [Flammeovirgaceae bacterium SG7u.111]